LWSCIGNGGGVAVSNATVVVTWLPWRLAIFIINECLRALLLCWNPIVVVHDDMGDNLVTPWLHSATFDVDEEGWRQVEVVHACIYNTIAQVWVGNTTSLPMWNPGLV
jgi:hypothetical protein